MGFREFMRGDVPTDSAVSQGPRTLEQAWQALQALASLRSVSRERRTEWELACTMLRDTLTREAAQQNSAIAAARVEQLQIAEPPPAIEDFLPPKLRPYAYSQGLELYAAVYRSFYASSQTYSQREQYRCAELTYTRSVLNRELDRERAERVARQRRMWPRGTLDTRIEDIDGIEEQVAAQNTLIEAHVSGLGALLIDNPVGRRPTLASDLNAMADDPDDVVNDVEQAVQALISEVESFLGCEIPNGVRVAYTPESRQAVIEYELPDVSLIPTAKSYKYIKSRSSVIQTDRPSNQIKSLYASVIQQLSLLVVAAVFDSRIEIDVVVFNGIVDTLDPRTGQPIRPCLITVRVTREMFRTINLEKVDPQACLRHLSAGVSKSPTELAPVKPVLEFSMADPRFVAETDAISGLDARPNLLEMKPNDFESLIQNLFTRMGLEARQTRPSRDGGVDCIAYDTRPIFGGKVVIQAKRYKNTVGVSAVRDLYGTLQNEGASKGILVTTSGYGQASFEFAKNKPIELIEGPNLLYLLAEHAGIQARIEPPEDWRDPVPDSAHHDTSG
ncbi:restriction endonuclease [Mycobacterium sp. BK558]|nr:restriction endonuclease [Mycobacterium sp. BK558]